MEEQRPTRRRWFQFSLRTLLVVILFIGFGGAWVGMQLQQKRRHEAVVDEILKSGGNLQVRGIEPIPSWKKHLFGVYALERWSVDVINAEATDSLLAQMNGMNLVRLILSSTQVTDAGLAHLKGMDNLEELYLSNTQVTDAGLANLQGLTSLEWLTLSDTPVTDAGLMQLKGFNSLGWLDLKNTQVTQAGVDRLQKAIPRCMIDYSPKETTSDHAPRYQP